ncbi:endonuclease/exonuclease/phosphatase family protein [Jannaschia donghaensis]|uniref:Endonuclease/exonuclease/phosphatase domain-containing protein n=1 Tax=Jannaschia donghaensis TaxID=420998 RepID=A0A0M6YPB6_9RHOB|nr:endonuclease/exonuclease/phosphatase family protein [Jannaschia donghaensis]CTQ51087.1 hypothetical protein JDO7802_03125 [Jannaschia donghaensis]
MQSGLLILALGLLGCALTVAGAWFGRAHPILDSLGVGLIYGVVVAVGLTVIFGVLRRWPAAIAGLAIVGAGVAILVPASGDFTTPSMGRIALLQHNLLFTNPAPDLLARMADADVVTLQEVSAATDAIASLPSDWTVASCVMSPVTATVVATRWPVRASGCFEGGTWQRIETPDGPVTFVSLHLYWPWPKGQTDQVARLEPDLRALPRPVIVAGDFNQTPWSATAKRITAATDTRFVPGVRITLNQFSGFLRIPIDHVLVPRGGSGRAKIAGAHGSDHQMLIALVGPGTDR